MTLARFLILLSFVSVPLLAVEPRVAKYGCRSYGAVKSQPIFLGYLVLTDRISYEWKAKTGHYRHSGERVEFTSGTLLDQGIVGEFSLDREGKTHKIVLVPKDGSKSFRMVCTHSIDAN